MWAVYNSGNVDSFCEYWKNEDYTKEGYVIIGGDFNIRIGNGGSLVRVSNTDIECEERGSKDRYCSANSESFLKFCYENGWSILNGNVKGDEMGEHTFIGARGSSVIDYVLVNDKAREVIRKFRVIDRVESDHII